jgi:hypothetical protein
MKSKYGRKSVLQLYEFPNALLRILQTSFVSILRILVGEDLRGKDNFRWPKRKW